MLGQCKSEMLTQCVRNTTQTISVRDNRLASHSQQYVMIFCLFENFFVCLNLHIQYTCIDSQCLNKLTSAHSVYTSATLLTK